MSAGMDDCCPNHTKPCDPEADHCQSIGTCACQFLTISNIAFSQFDYPAARGRTLLMPAQSDRPSHPSSPPFRPPRI
jgi:hypothetical protein